MTSIYGVTMGWFVERRRKGWLENRTQTTMKQIAFTTVLWFYTCMRAYTHMPICPPTWLYVCCLSTYFDVLEAITFEIVVFPRRKLIGKIQITIHACPFNGWNIPSNFLSQSLFCYIITSRDLAYTPKSTQGRQTQLVRYYGFMRISASKPLFKHVWPWIFVK